MSGRWDKPNKSVWTTNQWLVFFGLMMSGVTILLFVYINPVMEIMNQMITSSYPEDMRGATPMAAGMSVFLILGAVTPVYILGRIVSYVTPKLTKPKVNPKW